MASDPPSWRDPSIGCKLPSRSAYHQPSSSSGRPTSERQNVALQTSSDAMSHAIVRIENLSKRYQLGASGTHYGTFREALTRAFTAPFLRRPMPLPAAAESLTLWALRDLSL